MIFARTWSASDRVLTGVVASLIGALMTGLGLFFELSSYEFLALMSAGVLQLAAGMWWRWGRRLLSGNDRVGTGLFLSSLGSNTVDWNPLHPLASIPYSIFGLADSPYPEDHARGWAVALVLTVFIMLTSLGARWFAARNRRKLGASR